MDTIEKIIELMQQKGISGTKLQKDCNLPNSAFSQWNTGKAKPSADALIKLADYFDVSVDYLLGRDEKKEAQPDRAAPLYSAEEQKLIEIYKRCPKETQMVIMNLMNGLAAELDTKNGDIKLTADKLA